jgi:hypothetical protein
MFAYLKNLTRRAGGGFDSMPSQGKFLVCVVVLGAIGILSAYAFRFGTPWSSDQGVWGQAGDFFGGLLNPLISFATLVGVWTAVKLQRDELNAANKALLEQNAQIIEQNRINTHQYVAQLFFSHLEGIQTTIRALRVPFRHENAIGVVREDILAGEDALLCKANYFRNDPTKYVEKEESPTFEASLFASLQPIFALVLGAARHIEYAYKDEARREEFLAILAANTPYDLLFCACLFVDKRNDTAFAQDMVRFGLLRYFPEGGIKNRVNEMATRSS